jgi:hypothetical protein
LARHHLLKGIDIGQRGDQDLGLFGDVARRGSGDPTGLGEPRHSPVGDVVADDLEAVTQEVAHHRRAHDANADDADDAPGHHALRNLCRRSANRDCSSSARDVIARSASRATSNPERTSTQRPEIASLRSQ